MSASNRSVGLKVKRAGIKAWEGKSEQCEEKENVPYIGIFSSNMSRKKCRELLTHGGARVSVTLRAVFVFVSEHLCVWEGVCVCVRIPWRQIHVLSMWSKASAGPRFVWVCVCWEASGPRRLMTSVVAAAPDRIACAALSILPHHPPPPSPTSTPPQHPLLPGHRRLMHSTSPQGPGGQTHMCVCMRVCLFDGGATPSVQYHAPLNGLVRWQWAAALHPHAYTLLSLPPQ